MSEVSELIDTWELTSISNTIRLQKQRRRRFEMKLKAIEYKGGKCIDCNGSFHHAAMEFHHIANKKFSINQILGRGTLASIQAELDKCILLCSNCHQIRHFKEQNIVFLLDNPP